MPYKCCLPGSRAGYDSVKPKRRVAMIQFPKEPCLRLNGLTLYRERICVTASMRVCANHFSADDFETESQDKRSRRWKTRESPKLKRLRLKKDSIPHIFPSLPKYLSKPNCPRRSTLSTASTRLYRENSITEKLN